MGLAAKCQAGQALNFLMTADAAALETTLVASLASTTHLGDSTLKSQVNPG